MKKLLSFRVLRAQELSMKDMESFKGGVHPASVCYVVIGIATSTVVGVAASAVAGTAAGVCLSIKYAVDKIFSGE